MSEIKGQLLGIVMVIAVFGAVAGVLYGAFQASAKKISDKVATEDQITPIEPQKASVFGNELLTF